MCTYARVGRGKRDTYRMTGMSSDAMRVSTYLVNSLIFSSPNLVLMLCSRRATQHTHVVKKRAWRGSVEREEEGDGGAVYLNAKGLSVFEGHQAVLREHVVEPGQNCAPPPPPHMHDRTRKVGPREA